MGIEKSKNKNTQIVIQIPAETTASSETSSAAAIETKAAVSSKIKSPSFDEKEEEIETVTVEACFPININLADAEELMHLKGIGEVLSAEIVRYRNENGDFKNIEEIMNVPGIGIGIFEKISEYIYVEDPVYPTEVYEEDLSFEEPPENEESAVATDEELTLEGVAPIDLNTADAELLKLLPYVDDEIAGKIIELRSMIGRFSNIYELFYVEELNTEQLADIFNYVYVENE